MRRHVERLCKPVGGDGHRFKTRRQVFHRLVVAAVYRQMIDFQAVKQRRIFLKLNIVYGYIVWGALVMLHAGRVL